jgi:hypothetical protein
MALRQSGTPAGVTVLPPIARRPGSAAFADVYGGLTLGGMTTAQAGGDGAAREAAAAAAGEAPVSVAIGPDFLKRPAGVVVVLLGALIA